jgi:hypothetical protein
VGRDAGSETAAGDRTGAFLVYSWFAVGGLSLLFSVACIMIVRLLPPTHFWIIVSDVLVTAGFVLNIYVGGLLVLVFCVSTIELLRDAGGRHA